MQVKDVEVDSFLNGIGRKGCNRQVDLREEDD